MKENLEFTLNEMGEHWIVLNRGAPPYVLLASLHCCMEKRL